MDQINQKYHPSLRPSPRESLSPGLPLCDWGEETDDNSDYGRHPSRDLLFSFQDTMPPAAETEGQLRVNVARIVQKILLLLNASNCLGPCVRWYTEQLVQATETFHSVDRSSSEFPMPSSLVGYGDRGFSFHEKRGHVSPQKKGIILYLAELLFSFQ